jgi:pimeloyl-ACP methyl ester carboxylesterase
LLRLFCSGIATMPHLSKAVAPDKATIVLVHGAFAESSSWNEVIRILSAKGYSVVAVANPLRGVKSDAEEVSAAMSSIKGPVVLVGHSYGGSVISNASASPGRVKALVYVAAFAPEAGETAAALSAKFQGRRSAMRWPPRWHSRTAASSSSSARSAFATSSQQTFPRAPRA